MILIKEKKKTIFVSKKRIEIKENHLNEWRAE
jgi:hypothetical protein